MFSSELCLKCKGYKKLCGLPECPLLKEYREKLKAISSVKHENLVDGATPPSALLGEKNYPKISFFYNIAPGKMGDKARIYDDPMGWWGKKSFNDLVSLRTSLFSATKKVDARNPWSLYTKEYGLAVISERPVDSEVFLSKTPHFKPLFDSLLKPVSIISPAKEIKVVSNPRLPRFAEKVIWEDALAYDLVIEGFLSGVDEYLLTRLFSLGFLGRLKKRRICLLYTSPSP
jgi:hypothetical protein